MEQLTQPYRIPESPEEITQPLTPVITWAFHHTVEAATDEELTGRASEFIRSGTDPYILADAIRAYVNGSTR